jgi:hypothetical protein
MDDEDYVKCHCTGQTSDGVSYGPADDCVDCHGTGRMRAWWASR